MKTIILFVGLLLTGLFQHAFAQKENNNWAFGDSVGLNFSTPFPTILPTSINGVEGCASISDASGNLLFYSNGLNVWDKTHALMPNGMGLLGGLSATQGVSIVALDADPDKYYVFTIQAYESGTTHYLSYSLVDMTLNGGKGDVVPGIKNVVLDSAVSEKMLVAPGCGSVWLMVHDRDSAIFRAYKIAAAGSIPPPVISRTAGFDSKSYYSIGEMKLSADFRTIAMGCFAVSAVKPIQKIELFDFDVETGLVSGYYAIDSATRIYSIEFSPDKSKLYVADFGSAGFQYDLSLLPDVNAVRSSKYKLAGAGHTDFRRGPDGLIYVLRSSSAGNLSCIHEPNKAGAACNQELDVPSLKNKSMGYISLGLDTYRPLKGTTLKASAKDTIVCAGVKLIFPIEAGRTDIEWENGSTDPAREISGPGTYWRKSIGGCFLFVDTFRIQVKLTDTTYALALDTVVCFRETLQVQAPQAFNSYLWSDGTAVRSNTFTTSGTKWVASTNYDCKMRIDSFRVLLTSFKVSVPDTVICPQETIPLNAALPEATAYLWQDNSTGPGITVDKEGTYWVKVSVGTCSMTDTIKIKARPYSFDLGPDQKICEGDSTELQADLRGNYTWSNGSTGHSVWANQSAVYRLQITDGGCRAEDSIRVDMVRCNNCIGVPNLFTPNNDGNNDAFKVLLRCPVITYEMIIVNRYGQQVFSGKTPDKSWDGLFNGQPSELGVYYYLVKVRFDYPAAVDEIYKGDVSLVR